MLIKRPSDIREHEVTDFALYQRRREFLKTLGGFALLGASGLPLVAHGKSAFSTDDEPTPYDDIVNYNNFIELGTGKEAPAENAALLKTSPWSVTVDGECAKPGQFTLEDILKPHPTEERIYRLRCVEGWSMVIPWQGFPLAALLKRFQPTSKAKYVSFETLLDRARMPGQKRNPIGWPYTEGLRMDEAMHPLSFIATGLYGATLPAQSGAPLRLVVPWKYGYKSIKSIVRIRFVEQQPATSWSVEVPDEYGFYANVNPEVDHPRWSQRKERRIGEFLKRETLPFNGYAEQVASLYSGMDLRANF
ncbi:MAG: protein-methionine-sulfoxide reductase catalytic subunit MsrP [Thiothrix sp.]|uniref:protein-methionine-sulfoxide reductase catalytic subunit MsrP n=1 Tax=Thiothrix sp. TaxID=1032 RepID=UPI002605E8A4|nr:protein-methionine-sulfoxide reductase catalytic subunit MsrP [Thiothrix sp.]MDD5393362.1 protein-methionine-sulfoxide reductase catalytic subunit MsrP [Thiothrix sp.]